MATSSPRNGGDPRPFPVVKVTPCGVQTPSSRLWPPGQIYYPHCGAWRNNLTALSQRYNLFFVAYSETIRVFQPEAFTQALPQAPCMIIQPALEKPSADGLFRDESPRAINHLITGDLGQHEILLMASDNGNICAYYTERIYEATIEAQHRRGENICPCISSEIVRPFFSQWVRLSAWGLAIHKHARMIAVSTNELVISVFAFALVESGSVRDESGQFDDYTVPRGWSPPPVADLRTNSVPSRQHNYLIELTSPNQDSIPSISFLNSEADMEGRWICSTNISGHLDVWDIWKGVVVLRYSLGESLVDPGSYLRVDYDQEPQRGWNVLALDPSWFRTVFSHEEANGAVARGLTTTPNGTWDITKTSRNIHNMPRQLFPHQARYRGGRDDNAVDPIYEVEVIPFEKETPETATSFHQGSSSESQGGSSLDLDASEDEDMSDDGSGGAPIPDLSAAFGDYTKPSAPAVEVKQRFNEDFLNGIRRDLPFLIMHFTETDIRLINNGTVSTVCAHPVRLRANGLRYPPGLMNFDRLNLMQTIPEHGLVIVGTQTGVVVVLSLTNIVLPDKRSRRTFRIEWILPFDAQERQDLRPNLPLAGIAVAPIQGHEIPPDYDSNPIPDLHRWKRDQQHLSHIDESLLETFPEIDSILPTPSELEPGTSHSLHDRRRSSFYEKDPDFPAEKYRVFKRPLVEENWYSKYDRSRRYRLLVHHTDGTVFSYEIEVPWEGKKQ